MKTIILLIHIFTTLVMPSKICFQPPCSVENEVADGFDEALKFCEKKGPMEMPFYGSQSQFYGICETDGGPNPGKPCIFPFIWQDKTYNGKLNKESTLTMKSKELLGKDDKIRNAHWQLHYLFRDFWNFLGKKC